MIKSYRYSLLPNEVQQKQLSQYFGSVRFVYNLGLETKICAWATNRKNLTCFDLISQMVELKNTDANWLKECPAQALQMSLRNLDNAYTKFFKGGGFPKFKNKYNKQSVQFPQNVRVDFDGNSISLPKLKRVKCVFHRQFIGVIKIVTVYKTRTNKYFVNIVVDNQEELPMKRPILPTTTVGVDLGIKTLATLSDGKFFENPTFLRRSLKRLRIEQRKLSRRFKRGIVEQSKSYQKQKLVVALLHEKIKNQRQDYLHKTSTAIIQSYDTVCLEDLNIGGMMKNKSLSLAIGEVGWGALKRQLEYKATWYGKNIITIGRFEPSSKICSSCGKIYKELALSERDWTCQNCGVHHDRDANAAINIKNFGLRDKPVDVNVDPLDLALSTKSRK